MLPALRMSERRRYQSARVLPWCISWDSLLPREWLAPSETQASGPWNGIWPSPLVPHAFEDMHAGRHAG